MHHLHAAHPLLQSFPTRRSSDLTTEELEEIKTLTQGARAAVGQRDPAQGQRLFCADGSFQEPAPVARVQRDVCLSAQIWRVWGGNSSFMAYARSGISSGRKASAWLAARLSGRPGYDGMGKTKAAYGKSRV